MRLTCHEPVVADPQEMPVAEGKQRSALRRGSSELILIADAKRSHLVCADYVVPSGARGQVPEERLRRDTGGVSRRAELHPASLINAEAVALR